MPAIRPGYIVETPPTTFGFGSADTTALQKAFSTDPKYTDTKDEQIKQSYQAPAELNNGEINDGGYMFGSVPVDYRDAPDLAKQVETGGGGKPGTPFGPNLASPKDGMNPASIPDSGTEIYERVKSIGTGYGVGSNFTSPAQTKPSRRLLGQNLNLGEGSGNAFVQRKSE